MHWILTVSDNFSLKQVLERPQMLLLPPFEVDPAGESLFRIEQLASGHTISFTVSQIEEGIALESDERLTGKEREEVSRKTWRMLRLGENFSEFLTLAKTHPRLYSATQQGFRLLRGASLFEDSLKSVILLHNDFACWHEQLVTWLVDRLGSPLPSNPTRHTFPVPREILWNQHLVEEMLGPELGIMVSHITEAFLANGEQLETLSQSDLPTDALVSRIREQLGIEGPALALVMLCLGRYNYVPTDERARQYVGQVWFEGQSVSLKDIQALFTPWQPWGGLAYWLSINHDAQPCGTS